MILRGILISSQEPDEPKLTLVFSVEAQWELRVPPLPRTLSRDGCRRLYPLSQAEVKSAHVKIKKS